MPAALRSSYWGICLHVLVGRGDYPGVTDAEITHTGYHVFDMPAQAALLGGSDGVLGLG